MAQVQFYKVSTLPGSLQANAFYYVENGDYAESYVTNQAGVAKALGNTAMINALIAAALASLPSSGAPVLFVADIAARDALEPEEAVFVLVQDATDDPSVSSGAALYAWNPATSTWLKVAEYESMDVQLTWSAIDGRPTSTPSQIDNAVSLAHTHTNKATLDLLGTGADGLTYNGQPVSSSWATLNW
ncbi:hypothetical protein [Pseudomonas citronellolis]|uniref:hypothetical protein n=1 Tax=Pseudomonas citronellolis TaxID=53408 RepID=UPI0023E431F7|nr:hypothetical protein [Pseudomonas citronellolis]MDF3932160.1 hypothetical protein [Pseudomonas citronellolis]